MTPWKIAALAVVLGTATAACARPRPAPVVPAPRPADPLRPMVVALDSGRYPGPTESLLRLARAEPASATGRAAFLLLAAARLDPRNPDYQLDRGASLLAGYLRSAPPGDWTTPVAASLYLLAQDAGADVAGAEASALALRQPEFRPAQPLPRLPHPPLTDSLADLRHQRDQLAARVMELEGLSADLHKELADTIQELHRIRQTVRP